MKEGDIFCNLDFAWIEGVYQWKTFHNSDGLLTYAVMLKFCACLIILYKFFYQTCPTLSKVSESILGEITLILLHALWEILENVFPEQ